MTAQRRLVKPFDFPKLVAHRGASHYAPENTLGSFALAKSMGAKAIETDIMLTKDDVPIVMHDNNLKRTTDFKGEVGEVFWRDIVNLNAGQWKGNKAYLEEPVPRFDQLLRFLKSEDLEANIEVKPYQHRKLTAIKQLEISHKTADIVLKYLLMEQANGPLPGIVISSFDIEALRYLHQHHSPWGLGLLLDTWPKNVDKLIDEIQPVSVHLNYRLITPKRMAFLKERGLKVLAYTVNSSKRADALYQFGVDGVFSDKPDLFKKVP